MKYLSVSILVLLTVLPGLVKAQEQCYGLLTTVNNFLKTTRVAYDKIKAKNYTEADAKSMDDSFIFYENYFSKIIKTSYGEENMARCLRLRCYTVYSSILYKNRQFKELEALAKDALTIADGIRFQGNPRTVTCVTMGNVTKNDVDEDDNVLSSQTVYTVNGKYDYTEEKYMDDAGTLFTQIAFALKRNGNTILRDQFFLKAFDQFFLTNSNAILSLRLAHDILADLNDADKVNDVIFAAAITYMIHHTSKTVKDALITATDKEIHQKAINVLMKGDHVTADQTNKNTPYPYPLSKTKAHAYFMATRGIMDDAAASPRDQLAVLKQLIVCYNKNKQSGIYYTDIPRIFPSDKVQVNNFSAEILKDNAPDFMEDLADILYNYYKQYDSYTHQEVISGIRQFYNAAGKKSKAGKAAKLLH